MSETMQHPPIPEPVLVSGAFELSVPRNAQGKRIGTGAIAEPLRPGLPGETLRGTTLKALFHAGRSMQAPRSLSEQTVNREGLGYISKHEQAQFETREQQGIQATSATQESDAQLTQLVEDDKQQTERALETTRSALQNPATKQAETAQPKHQDRKEEVMQPAEAKAQRLEPEIEQFYLRSRSDGSLIPITLPRNHTLKDATQAIRSLGGNFSDYEAAYTWTPRGLYARFKDMWQIIKKVFEASAPPAALQK